MNEPFEALALDPRTATAAYPLVRLHDAGISLRHWRTFARRRSRTTSGRSGLMALRDCRGIVHAVFTYRTDIDLRRRKRLCIGNLIVAHVPGSGIDDAIAGIASRIAERLGCQTITLEQMFTPHTSFSPGCPTARLLRDRQGSLGSARRH
jgi:hypothetical protein